MGKIYGQYKVRPFSRVAGPLTYDSLISLNVGYIFGFLPYAFVNF